MERTIISFVLLTILAILIFPIPHSFAESHSIDWKFSFSSLDFADAAHPNHKNQFTVNDPTLANNSQIDTIQVSLESKNDLGNRIDSILLYLTESADDGIFQNNHIVFMKSNSIFSIGDKVLIEYVSEGCFNHPPHFISDGNCNPAEIDSATLYFFSQTDPSGIFIELHETGINTNLFTTEITLSDSLSSANNKILKVSDGDRISVQAVFLGETSNGLITPSEPGVGAIKAKNYGSVEVSYKGQVDSVSIIPSSIRCERGSSATCGTGSVLLKPIFIDSNGGSDQSYLNKPTFGLSHDTGLPLVAEGFTANEKSIDITDNWHTNFEKQTIQAGKTNTFSAKAYSSYGLQRVEFMFGISEVGKAHESESIIEVWLDRNGHLQNILVEQKDNLINPESLSAIAEMKECDNNDSDKNCNLITISASFNEAPVYDIFALKGVDFTRRSHLTYLNDGFSIEGKSLNPPKTKLIASGEKGVGLIEITQIDKKNNIWIDNSGAEYKQNSFGTFLPITSVHVERNDQLSNVMTRQNSNFDIIKQYELKRATKLFDSSLIQNSTPESFSYLFSERMDKLDDPEIERKMILEKIRAESIMLKILNP